LTPAEVCDTLFLHGVVQKANVMKHTRIPRRPTVSLAAGYRDAVRDFTNDSTERRFVRTLADTAGGASTAPPVARRRVVR
jgi:hypothetical protein